MRKTVLLSGSFPYPVSYTPIHLTPPVLRFSSFKLLNCSNGKPTSVLPYVTGEKTNVLLHKVEAFSFFKEEKEKRKSY